MATNAQIFTDFFSDKVCLPEKENIALCENLCICGKKNMFFNVFCNKIRLP